MFENHGHTAFDTGGTAFAATTDVTGATHADDTWEGARAGTSRMGAP